MTKVSVNKGFIDWDGVSVSSGEYGDADILRMGYSNAAHNWFYNIVQKGVVVAVTMGYPADCKVER